MWFVPHIGCTNGGSFTGNVRERSECGNGLGGGSGGCTCGSVAAGVAEEKSLI